MLNCIIGMISTVTITYPKRMSELYCHMSPSRVARLIQLAVSSQCQMQWLNSALDPRKDSIIRIKERTSNIRIGSQNSKKLNNSLNKSSPAKRRCRSTISKTSLLKCPPRCTSH